MAKGGNYPRSAYLHIPFCHRRCFYCDFAVVPLGDTASGDSGPGSLSIKSYLKLLHREIESIRESSPLSTVYIGGGTPSLLSSEQINSLLEHLQEKFGFYPGIEITLEIDPASFGKNDLEAYVMSGVNRISLGVQSFNDDVLHQIGRRHKAADAIEACQLLDESYKSGSISSWSLDLIQGIPGQDLSRWERQLKDALSTSPPHLSIYELSLEPGTVFFKRKERGELTLPNEEIAIEMMRLTASFLQEFGFGRYEISNYALPGHASRHNRVYWSGAGWWGFGQGATSAPWGERFTRPRVFSDYQCWVEKQVEVGLDPSLESQYALPMQLDEKLMVGLRCREGVDLECLAIEYGWSKEQSDKYLNSLKNYWEEALKLGLIQCQGKRLKLTSPRGMEISNQILVQMFLWWDSLPGDAVSQSNCGVPQ